jgi:hypothetical protein
MSAGDAPVNRAHSRPRGGRQPRVPMVRESLREIGLVRPRPGEGPVRMSTGRLRIALLTAIVLGACVAVAVVAVLVALGVTPAGGG